jgi:hypothetical protein
MGVVVRFLHQSPRDRWIWLEENQKLRDESQIQTTGADLAMIARALIGRDFVPDQKISLVGSPRTTFSLTEEAVIPFKFDNFSEAINFTAMGLEVHPTNPRIGLLRLNTSAPGFRRYTLSQGTASASITVKIEDIQTEPTMDLDNDTIPNSSDNCKAVTNFDQIDLDQDRIGDACDDDIDGDGIANGSDSLPYVAYIAQVYGVPTSTDSSITLSEDAVSTGNLFPSVTDPDSSMFTWTVVTAPQRGVVSAINNLNGTFTYSPNVNENGLDSFTFKVCDDTPIPFCSPEYTIGVSISAVNDAPASGDSSLTVLENAAPTSLSLLPITDPDSSSFRWSILTAPTNGTISPLTTTTGVLTYTPNANVNGTDSLTYKVCDDTTIPLCSPAYTVTITIIAVQHALAPFTPTITVGVIGAPASCTGTTTDGDGTALTYEFQWRWGDTTADTFADVPGGITGSFVPTQNSCSGSCAHKFLRCTMTASDGEAITIGVSAAAQVVNSSPTVNSTVSVGKIGEEASCTAVIADADGDALSSDYQWSNATTSNGPYTDIPGARSAMFTPTKSACQGNCAHRFLKCMVSSNDGAFAPNSLQSGTSNADQVDDTPPVANAGTTNGGTTLCTEFVNPSWVGRMGIASNFPQTGSDADGDPLSFNLGTTNDCWPIATGVATLFSWSANGCSSNVDNYINYTMEARRTLTVTANGVTSPAVSVGYRCISKAIWGQVYNGSSGGGCLGIDSGWYQNTTHTIYQSRYSSSGGFYQYFSGCGTTGSTHRTCSINQRWPAECSSTH